MMNILFLCEDLFVNDIYCLKTYQNMIKYNRGCNMKYEIDQELLNVEIIRKNNKNTYIRVKDDCTIYVTTSHFTTKKQIEHILDKNKKAIQQMILRKCQELEMRQQFYYLGNQYDIIIVNNFKNIEIIDNKIFAGSQKQIDTWYKKETLRVFKGRLDDIYKKFVEEIPYPSLKIRSMKTRWGVCNKQKKSITLNANLIRYDISKIDYVIVHELSHFVYFDHSKNFWNLVNKYSPNYKTIRKELKN